MEYSKRRMAALQQILKREKLDGAFFATGASFAYLLALTDFPFQRTSQTKNQRGIPSVEALNTPDCILYLPAEGEGQILCTPWRERDLQAAPLPVRVSYLDYFAEVLRPLVCGEHFAIGDCCGPWLAELLCALSPNNRTCPGESFCEELRCYKQPEEMALLRTVAQLTDTIMGEVTKALRPGISPNEVEAMLVQLGAQAGTIDLAFSPGVLFVKEGHPTACDVLAYPKDLPLTQGTSIAFDFGYVLHGYCSDFGRSFFCGKAAQHLKDAYRALQQAQCKMIADIIPGKTNIKDIDGMVRQEVTRQGFGEVMTQKEKGVIGHQIGIDCHEMPWMNKSVDFILQPGMVFCAEPKIWFPNECYMRVEDMIAVTQDGAVSLTVYDREQFEL